MNGKWLLINFYYYLALLATDMVIMGNGYL